MPVLRVATWNCQHGKPDPAKLASAVALLGLGDATRRDSTAPGRSGPADPHGQRSGGLDVLAIQEVDRHTGRVDGRDLAVEASEAFGGELVWAPAISYQGGEYGNALLVRGEVRRSVVVTLPGRKRREPRVAAVAEVVAAGRPWTVAATHLTTDRSIVRRQLLALLDVLGGWPAPRILAGDLNMEPSALLPWMTAEGYRLALGPATHSVRRPRRQIDHLAVAGRHCTIAAVGAEALPVGDHLALVAEVMVGGR